MESPHSLQIIDSNSSGTITLNEEALRYILSREEIKDRYISVISITGVFRQGKSFLLNFLLRYLRLKYLEQRDVTDWLKAEDGPLTGFNWSPGSRRHTTGINMWSEIFLAQLPTGEQVAIILLDTQGAFDNQTDVGDCATIFALSTLISSVQIYNVMRGIKQYDLTHLQCFGGYGSLLTSSAGAPFQNLCFLVRDWACPYEHAYGLEGGSALLQEVFSSKNAEVGAQVDNVKRLFNRMNCFLLPYPGRVVDTSDRFDGNLDEIDDDFKKHVQEFVSMILSPENLVMKTVHGEKIKAEDFIYYIQEYSNVLKEGTLPKIETVFQATVEAHHKAAASQALKLYKKNMDVDCKYNPRCSSEQELYNKHALNKVKAVNYFDKIKKIEDAAALDKYLVQLKDNMDVEFIRYREINEEKLKKFQETKRRMQEQIRLTTRENSGESSLSLGNLGAAEKVGLAASVIGGVAVLAFGVSKLFTSSRGNND